MSLMRVNKFAIFKTNEDSKNMRSRNKKEQRKENQKHLKHARNISNKPDKNIQKQMTQILPDSGNRKLKSEIYFFKIEERSSTDKFLYSAWLILA